jgi:hypothetical protein
VSDQGAGRAVWGSKGEDNAAVKRFFDDLGRAHAQARDGDDGLVGRIRVGGDRARADDVKAARRAPAQRVVAKRRALTVSSTAPP